MAIFIVATSAGGCYVPYWTHARVPDGAETVLPPQLRLAGGRLLAIPLWLSFGNGYFLGSPVVLESAELGRIAEMTSSYHKVGMIDVFGHEGRGVPHFRELFLLTETGMALRARYETWSYWGPKKKWSKPDSGWTEVYLAPVTDVLRDHLEQATKESTIDESFGSAAHEFWFPPGLIAYYQERTMPIPAIMLDVPWNDEQRSDVTAFLDSMATGGNLEVGLWELAMDLNSDRHERELL